MWEESASGGGLPSGGLPTGGGLPRGSASRGACLGGWADPPLRTRKAGGMHPTGMLPYLKKNCGATDNPVLDFW